MFFAVQSWVLLILGVGAFGIEIYALVDCLRRRPDAFVAASKRTKQFWSILLAVAAAVGFVVIFSPLSIFGLLAVVAGAIYLADVRPALDQVTGRRGSIGPYGPW